VESGVARDEAAREREKNDRERMGDMAVVCNTHQTALDNDAKLPKDHCQGPLKIPIKVGH
jgi:hypothetical protein